jgi:hypothetical protein
MSETSKRNLQVVAWELPVLMAVHEGKCKVLDGERLIDRPAPDAGYEFDRLERRYGAPRTDNGEIAPTPYVALVYGAGSIGVGRLQEAMRAHVITDMIDPLSMDSAEDSGGRFPRMDFADMTGLAEEAVPVTV